MTTQIEPATVTTTHCLLRPAMADLERAKPHPQPGETVALVADRWRETYIMTRGHGWLRLPK